MAACEISWVCNERLKQFAVSQKTVLVLVLFRTHWSQLKDGPSEVCHWVFQSINGVVLSRCGYTWRYSETKWPLGRFRHKTWFLRSKRWLASPYTSEWFYSRIPSYLSHSWYAVASMFKFLSSGGKSLCATWKLSKVQVIGERQKVDIICTNEGERKRAYSWID